jgi:hypothetical protein
VLPIREFLPHRCPARTGLTGSLRVDRLQRATSVFSFVRKLGKEGGPRRIVYRLGEHAACQALDVQVFDSHASEVLYQPEREFVLKLVPLVLNTLVNLFEQPHRFAAAVGAFLATSNLALQLNEELLAGQYGHMKLSAWARQQGLGRIQSWNSRSP